MAYQFKNMTVLLVESTRAMADLTKSILITFGVTDIHTAFTSQEGYEKFCTLEPDLVIIDWMQEPDSGLALTRRIRSSGDSPNPFTPIILMTGYSQKKRVLLARDSGITEFLVKPFTARALYQRIEQIIEMPRYFVVSDKYFGPDRRRKRDSNYAGPDRRGDNQPEPFSSPERIKATLSAAEKAREILRKHTQETGTTS
ncbi:MAG TPA: response regulator [Alphaproteobacteria bacterium]|nr:response regulator [Alphaproteobacteria bacterium]HRI75470.1 response regulator [Alphaproteobacteria bacterium]HRJ66741.1 response regulator [Alphaproteobacteria bacterium]